MNHLKDKHNKLQEPNCYTFSQHLLTLSPSTQEAKISSNFLIKAVCKTPFLQKKKKAFSLVSSQVMKSPPLWNVSIGP
jgi:hypothetical protein